MNANVRELCGVSAATANRILSSFVRERKLSKYHEGGHWVYAWWGGIIVMKKKHLNIDIDDITAISSKTRVCEKSPIKRSRIVFLFFLLFILLAVCFVMDDWFTTNQMTFLGVFGASIISIFTIIVTLNHEKRSRYITARKSALMLSDILDSLYSQIEQIKNGSILMVVYPTDWICYYENCCTYLKYNYLPYFLREFDVVEKLNKCVEREDKAGIQKLLDYRNKSITDWTLGFNIISAKSNLSLFASGYSEHLPWIQQPQYKEFKEFIVENYSDKIKELTVSYLNDHNGHSDATDAEYYVMEQIRTEETLQTGKYRYIAIENRAMLYAIFSVYLSRKPEDTFELCWGELSLKIPKDDI